MRVLSLLAVAAFALSACGDKGQADNNVSIDQDLTAESIVANDVTAIDAVTADSANMAEDVDIAFTNEVTGEEEGANGASSSSKPKAAPNQTKPSTGSTATAASRAPAKDAAGGTPTTNSAE